LYRFYFISRTKLKKIASIVKKNVLQIFYFANKVSFFEKKSVPLYIH